MVDFAADAPFAQVQLKLREHYGFEIGESTIQRISLGHAQAIFESGGDNVDFPKNPGLHKQIVAQIAGGMIPVMTPDASQKDKRKGKTLSWREAKSPWPETPIVVRCGRRAHRSAGRPTCAA